jgi:hypothetical protein
MPRRFLTSVCRPSHSLAKLPESEVSPLPPDWILPDTVLHPVDWPSHRIVSTISSSLEGMPEHRLQARIGHLHPHRFLQATNASAQSQQICRAFKCDRLTAVTRLDTYARTCGSTTSLLPSPNSILLVGSQRIVWSDFAWSLKLFTRRFLTHASTRIPAKPRRC